MEKLFDFHDSVTYRFGCDCYTPAHALDIEIRRNDPDALMLLLYCTPGDWWQRLRWCWQMLRTGQGFEHEFIFKPGDVFELVKILTEVTKGE